MRRTAILILASACAVLCLLSIADSLMHSGRKRCDHCSATMVIAWERHDDLCEARIYECPVCHRQAHEHEWVWEQ